MRNRDVLSRKASFYLIFVGSVLAHGLSPSLSAQETASVRLGWDANTEANLGGYKLYYGSASRQYSGSLDVGKVTVAEIGGLVRGSTYYFAVTAYNTSRLESTFSQELSITIPVNAPPTLDPIANIVVAEDSGLTLVPLSGISSGDGSAQTLKVTASSSNPSLIPSPAVMYTSPAETAFVGVQPTSNLSGSSVITVTVSDGQTTGSTVTRTFTVTVNPVNDQPFFDAISDVVLPAGVSSVSVPITGISAGPNESQSLTVTAFSSQAGIVRNPVVTYTSPASSGSLQVSSTGLTNGSSVITVTLRDGATPSGTFSRTFVVTVGNDENELPVISQLSDQVVSKNRVSAAIPFTISDAETQASQLTITLRTSNAALLPVSNILISGTGSNRYLTLDPVNGMVGTAVVTLLVGDGTGVTSASFEVDVRSVLQ